MFLKATKFNIAQSVLIVTSWLLSIGLLILYLNALNGLKSRDGQIGVFSQHENNLVNLDNSYFNTWSRSFEISLGPKAMNLLKGNLGLKINSEYLKDISVVRDHQFVRIEYTPFDIYKSIFEITINSKQNTEFQCNSYEWKIASNTRTLNPDFEDCFQLTDAAWYGGAESYTQQFWPINNQTYHYKPYLSGLFGTSSAVLERYWLSSNGVAIIVNQSVPLFVNMNKTSICFLAANKYPYPEDNKLNLQYDVCTRVRPDPDPLMLKNLHLFIVANYLGKPEGIPDDLMFKRPIWSTWANFKKDINENNVLDYARDIIANNYSHSQIEIDDEWATKYGDFEFDQRKFPNIKTFVKSLKDLGFRVTMWMHPFANFDSKNFILHVADKFWVTVDGSLPALTAWWNGIAGILDTTYSEATTWFVSQLNNLRDEYGIDSFKFDAGRLYFFPFSALS
jgi:hypothetical protein